MQAERRLKVRNILIAIAILVAAFGLLALAMMLRPAPPKKPVVDTTPLVEVQPLSAQDWRIEVQSQGSVRAKHETTLVTEVAGVVRELSPRFVAGGLFKKGDVLLRIDQRDYDVAVQQAKAALASAEARLAEEQARAEVARREWESLYKEGRQPTDLALRKPFVAQAEAAIESAKADLAAAERKLERTIIRAPYDGMVRERRVDLGQYVNIGNPLGVIFATDKAEVRLPVTDTDLAFIDVQGIGQQVSTVEVRLIGTTAIDPGEWQAKLVRGEGVVDDLNRMHYFVAEVADPYGLKNKSKAPLKVGAFVDARITGRLVDAVYTVPRRLIRQNQQLLVVDAEQTLQFRQVELLRTDSERAYFKNGIQAGDQAVLTAMETPVAGTKVRLQNGSAEQPPATEVAP